MKKWIVFVMAALLLTGCGAEETFETVADELIQPVSAQVREILVELPPEAAAPASESDSGTLYLCDGYEIALQTMASGDLNATIQSISGYNRENLTVIESNAGEFARYELVWASAGENGERVGKAAILDDGSYHYVLSVLADADRAEEYAEVWQALFGSFALG